MILDGKTLSLKVLDEVKKKVESLSVKPHLVVILVGNNPASQIYVRNKKLAAEKVGIKSTIIELNEDTSEEELLCNINELNQNPEVTGILVQLPLPSHIDKNRVITAISPKKDVDGFTPENVGKLAIGLEPYFYPATPQGILMLLDEYNIKTEGADVLVIGRSNIVGRPMAQMLLQRNATVTLAHSYTKDLDDKIKTADIVISAVGKKIVRCKMVKNKAVFIDVGISRDTNDKLTGDLNWELDFNNFNEVIEYFGYISPVPGGVGPMTIACLMESTYECYLNHVSKN